MHYEGPIYRPPSEADSLLVQATVGCPHNLCTFCMVYKQGVKFKVRPTREVKADLEEACQTYGSTVRTIFLPAGNTIAMPTAALAEVCRFAASLFPRLERITVYGSAQYIFRKGFEKLEMLAAAGLKRIHLGLESGDDAILTRVRKGTDSRTQIAAGRLVRQAGMELNAYVILGLGGREQTDSHARETARVINEMAPHVVRCAPWYPRSTPPCWRISRPGASRCSAPTG